MQIYMNKNSNKSNFLTLKMNYVLKLKFKIQTLFKDNWG